MPEPPSPGPGGAPGDLGRRLGELARLFLRLGITAFGGPAAHVAMMHHEVVRRRGWIPEERFVDLVGATNLIPGPNSTELAIYLGWDRARGRGLVVAGVCFIAPAALIVTALAWVYVTYDRTPVLEGVLYGIKPVVVAIVGQALVALLPVAAKTRLLALLAAASAAAFLAGIHELAVLAAGALLAAGAASLRQIRPPRLSLWLPVAAAGADVELGPLFLTFLRIGAVLYGSGYVLLAFLQSELVDRLGWITGEELLDAVSIGQVTPGPVFTTATFIGYLTAGVWGAVVATLGIFLPSFVFVALLSRLVDWMRASPALGAALDGVNAAALGLMAGVVPLLARDALVDVATLAILVVTGLALWRTRVSSTWLIAAGALAGIVHSFAT